MKIKFEWEEISRFTDRAKVFNGWIVRSCFTDNCESMVFISDPNHEWEIEENEQTYMAL